MCSKMYGCEYTQPGYVQLADLLFFNDGKEGLPIERKKYAGCEDTGLLEERGE